MLLSLCESIWKNLKVNPLSFIIAIQIHYCFSLAVFHISVTEPQSLLKWFLPAALKSSQAEGGSTPCREGDKQGDRRSGIQSSKPSPSQSSPRSPVSLAPKSSSSFTKSQVTFRWIQPSCGAFRLKILSLQGCNSASSQNKGVGAGKSGSSDCSNKGKLPGRILPKAEGTRGIWGYVTATF